MGSEMDLVKAWELLNSGERPKINFCQLAKNATAVQDEKVLLNCAVYRLIFRAGVKDTCSQQNQDIFVQGEK